MASFCAVGAPGCIKSLGYVETEYITTIFVRKIPGENQNKIEFCKLIRTLKSFFKILKLRSGGATDTKSIEDDFSSLILTS